MLPDSLITLILFVTSVNAQNTATGTAEVAAAAATAKSSSPVSYVKGKAFDRIAIIWLENTDYDKAVGDREYSSISPAQMATDSTLGFDPKLRLSLESTAYQFKLTIK
jgi:hypothetical protein